MDAILTILSTSCGVKRECVFQGIIDLLKTHCASTKNNKDTFNMSCFLRKKLIAPNPIRGKRL